MFQKLKSLLWLKRVRPITKDDVEPSPIDERKEREIKFAQQKLHVEARKFQNASWKVREQLANHVINIVSGD